MIYQQKQNILKHNKKTLSIMTIQEFKKTVKIYKSHNLKNDFISVTYTDLIYDKSRCYLSACTVEKTVQIPKFGGALNSLYEYYCK